MENSTSSCFHLHVTDHEGGKNLLENVGHTWLSWMASLEKIGTTFHKKFFTYLQPL